MIRKKLTDSLKRKIRAEYKKLKASDFSGDALTYLNRVRGAAKSRKIKEDTTLKIDKLVIPKDSQLYEKISAVAEMKGQTVAKWIKNPDNKKAVESLFEKGGVTMVREAEYLINDIKKLGKGRKVFWNDEPMPRLNAIRIIMELQALSMQYSNIVMISFEVRFSLNGDLYIYDAPTWEEIVNALDEVDEYDTDEEKSIYWTEFLDKFPAITYIQSNAPEKS